MRSPVSVATNSHPVRLATIHHIQWCLGLSNGYTLQTNQCSKKLCFGSNLDSNQLNLVENSVGDTALFGGRARLENKTVLEVFWRIGAGENSISRVGFIVAAYRHFPFCERVSRHTLSLLLLRKIARARAFELEHALQVAASL